MFYFIPWPHLSLPPCFNPSTWRLILLNIQNKSWEGQNMINYRLVAAVSVYYIMQTLVKNTHLFCWCHFSHVPPVCFQPMPTLYYNSTPITTFYFLVYSRTSFSRFNNHLMLSNQGNTEYHSAAVGCWWRCLCTNWFVTFTKLFDSLAGSLIIWRRSVCMDWCAEMRVQDLIRTARLSVSLWPT